MEIEFSERMKFLGREKNWNGYKLDEETG